MKSSSNRQWAVVATLAVAILAGGCPRTPPPEVQAPAVTDAAGLIALIRSRTAGVERMDANVEIRLTGTGPYQGRFTGTLQMERREGEKLALWLQVYSRIGAPVLEAMTDGPRVEVYSPLTRTVLFNFTELMEGERPEEFPLSSFNEVALPLEMVREQFGLLWGLGLDADRRYELSGGDGSWMLGEWSGDTLLRQMTYAMPGPDLTLVSVFRGGRAAGTMKCGGYGNGGESSFFPSRIEISEGGSRLALTLSGQRFGAQAKGPAMSFRMPPHERLILLTPPVP